MKIVAISDTHGKHRELGELPEGDVLVHAGDWSMMGTEEQTTEFLSWFIQQPFKHRVLIAGNHDWIAQNSRERLLSLMRTSWPDFAQDPGKLHYLEDSGCTIEGVRFWGSPVQPEFCNWAFNRERGAEIKRHWDMIPDNTDVLITHGPAEGYGGLTARGGEVGCVDLWRAIDRVRPQVHICGHIHEDAGEWRHVWDDGSYTTLINASVLNLKYNLTRPPTCITVFSSQQQEEEVIGNI